jgi:hypothetical protein
MTSVFTDTGVVELATRCTEDGLPGWLLAKD